MADHRVLVAGVGNIFLGDDGFGVEVIKHLTGQPLPDWVRVADFGIRGIHLAYELLDHGYDTLILVDATPRGGQPGTVYLIDIDLSEKMEAAGSPDAHGMNPQAVFALLQSFGQPPPRIRLVGCEPARTEEAMGLSEPVQQAIAPAVQLILSLVQGDHQGAQVDLLPGGIVQDQRSSPMSR
jgi:hydrogenase maturation protease